MLQFSKQPRVMVAQVALVLGCLGLISFGILGLGKVPMPSDSLFLYVAGKMWAEGFSPYDVPLFQIEHRAIGVYGGDSIFAYPPQSSLICILFYVCGNANTVMVANTLSALSVIAIAYYCVELLRDHRLLEGRPEMAYWIAALVVGNPCTWAVMFMGQTSLWIAALIVSSWYYFSRGSDWIAGALLAGASMKPQLMLFLVLWYLMAGRWKALLSFSFASLVLVAFPALQMGLVNTFQSWIHGMEAYQAGQVNLAGNPFQLGIASWLGALRIAIPLWQSAAFGMVALVFVRLVGHGQTSSVLALGAVQLCQFLFFKSHTYDLIVLAPLIGYLLLVMSRSVVQLCAFLLLFGLVYMPAGLVKLSARKLHLSLAMMHWRLLVLGVLLFGVLYLIRQQRQAQQVALG